MNPYEQALENIERIYEQAITELYDRAITESVRGFVLIGVPR